MQINPNANDTAIRRSQALDRKVGMPFSYWLQEKCLEIPSQDLNSIQKGIFKLLDQAQKLSANMSPCRKGCSHCCHIPCELSEWEAQKIGAAIGRMPAVIPSTKGTQVDLLRKSTRSFPTGEPCPFLQKNTCSIYDHRPLACRQLISIDIDDTPCKHDKGVQIVQYLNLAAANNRFALALAVTQSDVLMADIREWFPVAASDQSK